MNDVLKAQNLRTLFRIVAQLPILSMKAALTSGRIISIAFIASLKFILRFVMVKKNLKSAKM